MKKTLCTLCAVSVLLTAAGSITPASAAAVGSEAVGEVYAVVTTRDGDTLMGGVPGAEEMQELDGYDVYVGKKPVISVGAGFDSEPAGLTIPRYYHAEFTIPDTTDVVYLTGLRATYVEEIQQAVIDGYRAGESFDMTDLGFIDTEKTMVNDGDESLCWAAATSNMLMYTGWAAKAGFNSEDEVFDAFAANFSDDGGYQENGLAWFFNGAALGLNTSLTGATINNYPNSGGYLKSYAYDMVSDWEWLRTAESMNRIYEYLRTDYAVSLGIDLFTTQQVGSHAITIWGMCVDSSLGVNDPARYKMIFITDSDSHMSEGGDRTTAVDVMSCYPLYYSNRRFWFDYDETLSAHLADYEYLVQYSQSVPRETDLSTSRSKARTLDLKLKRGYLSGGSGAEELTTLFETGTRIYGGYTIANCSDKRYSSDFVVQRRLTSSDGTVLTDETDTFTLRGTMYYTDETGASFDDLGVLPAGDYTLTYTLNPDHSVAEAYYYNNVKTIAFKVRDAYILGDMNGDGNVNIYDVTEIQRRLAGYIELSEKDDERGDIDGEGLSVEDATLIQRYLADYAVEQAVGEKSFHTAV